MGAFRVQKYRVSGPCVMKICHHSDIWYTRWYQRQLAEFSSSGCETRGSHGCFLFAGLMKISTVSSAYRVKPLAIKVSLFVGSRAMLVRD